MSFIEKLPSRRRTCFSPVFNQTNSLKAKFTLYIIPTTLQGILQRECAYLLSTQESNEKIDYHLNVCVKEPEYGNNEHSKVTNPCKDDCNNLHGNNKTSRSHCTRPLVAKKYLQYLNPHNRLA